MLNAPRVVGTLPRSVSCGYVKPRSLRWRGTPDFESGGRRFDSGRGDMPTWCNPASIRSCHGRDPGSNPGVGVDAWTNHAGIPIEVGSPLVRPSGRSRGAGPSRVCNLHEPVRYSWEIPKHAPAMRRAITTERSRLRSWKVVQIDNQLPNAWQSREPMVQRTTICALGAQDRGSNPRRLSVPRLGIGEPSGLLRRSRLLSASRFESGSRRHDNECLPRL